MFGDESRLHWWESGKASITAYSIYLYYLDIFNQNHCQLPAVASIFVDGAKAGARSGACLLRDFKTMKCLETLTTSDNHFLSLVNPRLSMPSWLGLSRNPNFDIHITNIFAPLLSTSHALFVATITSSSPALLHVQSQYYIL